MVKTLQELTKMVDDLYACNRAWHNDDGRMAEANAETPEDILFSYLEEAYRSGVKYGKIPF